MDFESLGSRVGLLDSGSSSSRGMDRLMGKSVKLRTRNEMLESEIEEKQGFNDGQN